MIIINFNRFTNRQAFVGLAWAGMLNPTWVLSRVLMLSFIGGLLISGLPLAHAVFEGGAYSDASYYEEDGERGDMPERSCSNLMSPWLEEYDVVSRTSEVDQGPVEMRGSRVHLGDPRDELVNSDPNDTLGPLHPVGPRGVQARTSRGSVAPALVEDVQDETSQLPGSRYGYGIDEDAYINKKNKLNKNKDKDKDKGSTSDADIRTDII